MRILLKDEQKEKTVDLLITFVEEVVNDRKNATPEEIMALPNVANILLKFNESCF